MDHLSFEAQLVILDVSLALFGAVITLLLKEWFARGREKKRVKLAEEQKDEKKREEAALRKKIYIPTTDEVIKITRRYGGGLFLVVILAGLGILFSKLETFGHQSYAEEMLQQTELQLELEELQQQIVAMEQQRENFQQQIALMEQQREELQQQIVTMEQQREKEQLGVGGGQLMELSIIEMALGFSGLFVLFFVLVAASTKFGIIKPKPLQRLEIMNRIKRDKRLQAMIWRDRDLQDGFNWWRDDR
jgi:hypothetical protein